MKSADDLSVEGNFFEGRNFLALNKVKSACSRFYDVLLKCPHALDDIAISFGHAVIRQEAITVLRNRVISGQGDHVFIHLILAARLARDAGRLHDASQWAEEAVGMDPNCAAWWFELGEILRETGSHKKAISAYNKCLSIDHEHMRAGNALLICKRHRWRGLARFLIQYPWFHRLIRRIVWSPVSLQALGKKAFSAAYHQRRWAYFLEWGSSLSIFPSSPPELRPDQFSAHWKSCRCAYWLWFLEQGIDKDIRKVLDVGCGTGSVTEHFVRYGYDVTGVTVNRVEKDECIERGIGILEDDFHFLSVPDGTFDLIFSSQSFEHSVSPLYALWEWKRVIRPGGYIMIILPAPIEQDSRAHFIQHYLPDTDELDFHITKGEKIEADEMRCAFFAYGSHGHFFVLTYWQLLWLFKLAGLELVNSAVENPYTNALLGLEHIDGRIPRDPLKTLNQIYLLRKPAR